MARKLLPADYRPPSSTVGKRATHGIATTYKRGCRCPECRAAWTIYRRPKTREYARRKALEKKLAAARALLAEHGE